MQTIKLAISVMDAEGNNLEFHTCGTHQKLETFIHKLTSEKYKGLVLAEETATIHTIVVKSTTGTETAECPDCPLEVVEEEPAEEEPVEYDPG